MSRPELGPGVAAPIHFALPTATETAAGRLRYDVTSRGVVVHDSVREKWITPIGWQTHAYPVNHSANGAFGTAVNLAAVSAGSGGAMLIPILLNAPMLLQSMTFRSTNASGGHSAEGRLYIDELNNSGTIDEITGSDCTWSFTAASASDQESSAVSGAGSLVVPPGLVWAVLRNTHGTNPLGVGTSGVTFATHLHWEQTIAALSTSIDAVTGWTASNTMVGFRLNGRVLGQTGAP